MSYSTAARFYVGENCEIAIWVNTCLETLISFLSIILFLSSNISYYFRNNTWKLSESYLEASIFIIIIFLVLSIFTTKEKRYIKGTVQWLRVEFLLLIQTFVFVIFVTVIFKTTDNYSRIWLFTNIVISSFLFLFTKVFFDYIYAQLVKSNAIQRNILLIGDAISCQNIIKKFPAKILECSRGRLKIFN